MSSSGVGGPGWGRVDVDEEPAKPRPWAPRSCSNKLAHWCPNHGTCSCTRLNGAGARRWDTEHHADCPLHGTATTHPFTRKTKTLPRRH